MDTGSDKYMDLTALAEYSSLKIPTLRDHIKFEGLPCFKCKGKLLVKRSEFDRWMEGFRVRQSKLDAIVEDALYSLKN